jgi:hypothetical protein
MTDRLLLSAVYGFSYGADLILDPVSRLFDKTFDLVNGAAGFAFVTVYLVLDPVASGGGFVFDHIDFVVDEIADHAAGFSARTGSEQQGDDAADQCAGKECSNGGAGIVTSHNQNSFLRLNFALAGCKFDSTNLKYLLFLLL